MSGILEGRVAVVTAAASGMGLHSSRLLALEGAHVVGIDIDAEAGARLVSEIESAGGTCEFVQVDLTEVAQIEDVATDITERHGHVDVLFNHAGSAGPRGFDFDERSWDRCVALNLTAPVFLTKLLWEALKQAENGASVVFTSSVSGVVASRNSPLYSTVKSGLLGFMRAMSAVGAPDGIRANAIAPGSIETPMLETFFRGEGESIETMNQRLDSFRSSIPLGRIGRPDEVAELVCFLAGPRSSFITGVTIPIDGGYVVV